MESKKRKIENCKENESAVKDCEQFERKTHGTKQEIEERNKMLNVTAFFFHINSSALCQLFSLQYRLVILK